ncbi:hypothetical protein EHW97_11435 [Aeromicrobium camelliae]|uniref:DUF1129 family protein n=1 Tax=Aeromicrobium camelliae TaxID=1538144 RepID=A0A3N6Z7W1_9ACTN|nr:hypothetical protein [Aeromicrobium camelliae]RQN03037.1 hypothetical protein EHW97_11435 [Aeromicrobium camelliae]
MTDRLEARLAPDMEPTWVEQFILEARLRDVPGDRIGDALTEANAHCRDAGETAEHAFGDPAAYARAIASGRPAERTDWFRLLAPSVVQLVGVVVTLNGVGAWAAGDAVTVTWGMAAMLVLLCLNVVALALVLDRALSTIVRRPVLSAVVAGGAAAVAAGAVAALLLIETPLVVLPFGAVLVVGVIILAAGIAAEQAAMRSGVAHDPITAPGNPEDDAERPSRFPWTSLTSLAWVAIGAAVIAVLNGR